MSESIGAQSVVSVCLVGFGLAGRVFHAPFIEAVPGLKLVAIVSRRLEEIRRAWPQVSIHASLADALAASPIDLVVVASPNSSHFSVAAEALLAGKHVVVDKPLATTSNEVRQLERLAQMHGCLIAPFHNRRWDGDFLTLRRILAEDTLGRLVTLRSRFDRFRPMVRSGNWKEAEGPAQGLLFDLGPHLVDQALTLFGVPEGISASVRQERNGTAVDDAFDLCLEYPGLRVMLGSSLLAADPEPRFSAHGMKGSFRKYGVDPQEPSLVAGAAVPNLGAEQPWLSEDPAQWGELTVVPDPARPDERQRSRVETLPGDYRGFYKNVRYAIAGGSALEVTADDAWRTLRILEVARESSDRGCRLPVVLNQAI